MTNKTDFSQFLMDVSQIFPISSSRTKERVWELTTDYVWWKIAKKEIDYKKAINWLIDNHKKNGFFPEPSLIADALKNAEIKPIYRESVADGALLVVTLSSGQVYEFTVSNVGKHIDALKANIRQKFGDCTYKFYPKGTLIIGGQVFMP